MIIVLLLVFLLVILFMFSGNESFDNEMVCSTIDTGECNSKLCPANCKIQHSSKTDTCYCTERK